MLATRFVSRRGAQNESWIATSLNGTGQSLSNNGSAPAASGPVRSIEASNPGSQLLALLRDWFARSCGVMLQPARGWPRRSQSVR